jgi:hypothetical protein
MSSETIAGLTVHDLAKRYRVSPDKVRNWIRKGELPAINTADRCCGRPRFVVTHEALAEFERGRQAAMPKVSKRKRDKKIYEVDYYPD